MTDSMRAIAGVNDRYIDWVSPKPVENRSGAEIAADVIKKAGLIVEETQ